MFQSHFILIILSKLQFIKIYFGFQIATGTISQQQGLQDKGYEEWAGEMIGMREILKIFANVSRSEVVGARAPFLKPGRNTQFKVNIYCLVFLYVWYMLYGFIELSSHEFVFFIGIFFFLMSCSIQYLKCNSFLLKKLDSSFIWNTDTRVHLKGK